ncbi:UBA domain-containing protein mud1-like [Diaphorina citri]|uniref:UBA domain-containing protein mud1-like n=1 Tax=Diaphorina citri TaxID=121845 RepID=A0A1S3DMT2_DIACI|nr:UBA domain-containing protein mud1-like [Diaphorina citri]
MLLGLDMLKRHQCCIDLRKNVLRIGTTGTETPFLSEGDLPEVLRLTHNDDDDELLKKALQESKNSVAGPSSSSCNGQGNLNSEELQGKDQGPLNNNKIGSNLRGRVGITLSLQTGGPKCDFRRGRSFFSARCLEFGVHSAS